MQVYQTCGILYAKSKKFLNQNWTTVLHYGGSIALISYYLKYPEQLKKISVLEIIKNFSIQIIGTAIFAVMDKYLMDKYPVYNKISATKENNITNNIISPYLDNIINLFFIVGEDALFIINFMPQFYNNKSLILLTSSTFGLLHYVTGLYSFKASLFKTILTSLQLNMHKGLINWNISYVVLDYAMLKLMRWSLTQQKM